MTPTPTPERKCPRCGAENPNDKGYTKECLCPCHATPESRLRDGLIEECIAIRGNKSYDGSYAAPREAFRAVLRKAVSQEREALVGEVESYANPYVYTDKGETDEDSYWKGFEFARRTFLALLKSKN